MYYVTEFQTCSLLILIIISGHFFTSFRFPLRQNKVFSLMLLVTIIQISCDLTSVYTVSMPGQSAALASETLNMVNYICLFLIPVIFFEYVTSASGLKKTSHKSHILRFYIPTGVFLILLFTNPFNYLFFHVINGYKFVKGPLFWCIPINLCYYFTLSLLYVYKTDSKSRQSKRHTIVYIAAVFTILASIELISGKLLLIGFALAISVVILYLSLQNPADMVDDMTGAYNKNSFLRYVADINFNKSYSNIIYINIDDTSLLNTTYGMVTGSMLLTDLAKYLKENCPKALTFRISGDQFVLIVPHNRYCLAYVAIIQKYFSTSYKLGESLLKPSACICYMTDLSDLSKDEEIIVIMEYMMTQAKAMGKGTVFEIDDKAMKERQRELDITSAFRDAVENETLNVYLQPIYNPETKKFVAAEALSRFNHPILGFIPPDEFIRLAEKNGLIVKIGLLVLKKVCVFLKEHPDVLNLGIKSIEVNLSAIELLQDNFAQKIIAITNEYSIDPKHINFEITETTASTIEHYVKSNMEELKKSNFTFSLDDFGTGYSNLDSIIILPFSIIKVDRSMLLGYFKTKHSATVFQGSIDMIKNLNLGVVVEGAETQEHVDLLHNIGVDFIQGYYYSRPIPMEDFLVFIREKNGIK